MKATGSTLRAAVKLRLLGLYGDWHYGRWLRLRQFQRLVAHLPCDLNHAEILDVGCGQGAAAFWLAQRFPLCHVFGIDINPTDVAACQRQADLLGLKNLRFAIGRLEDLQVERCYDFIYVIHVLGYIEDEAAAVARLKAVLRPQGVLLLDVPELRLGVKPSFGLRPLIHGPNRRVEHVREGYTLSHLYHLLMSSGLQIQGARYAMSPPSLFAHTVFELLRRDHFRWYIAVLPLLRLVGYTDLFLRWQRGGSLMMWAQRVGD